MALCVSASASAWDSQLYSRQLALLAYRANTVNYGGRDWRLPDYSFVGYQLGGKALASDIPCTSRTVTATGDITTALQAAIDAVGAAGGGTVIIPAGTFTISRSISVPYSNLSIVGAGSGRTFISVPSGYVAGHELYEGVFTLGKAVGADARAWQYRGNVLSSVVQPIPEGASTATLANGGAIAVGQWIVLQQYFWPALTVKNDASATWPSYTYSVFPPSGTPDRESSFTYLRQVTAKSGNTVTLDAPIPYALDPANNAIGVRSAERYNSTSIAPRNNLGIAGLSLSFADNRNGPDGLPSGRGVYFEGVRDGWAYDVQVRNFPVSGIVVESSARVTVSHSAVYRAQEYGVGSYGYGITVDDSQNVLVRANYAELSRHNFLNRGALDSMVVFSRNTSAAARVNGDDQHYRSSHGMLWDRHQMSNGTGLTLGYRGSTSSQAQESNLSSVVWNAGDDGYRGGSNGGFIGVNPSSSGYSMVVGGTGSYPVFDDGATPGSGQMMPARTGLQIGAVQEAPGPGSRDRNVLYEGIRQPGLVPESLYDGMLAQRIGVAPPDFATQCRAAPAVGATTPSRYAGSGTLVFNEDQLGYSAILGSGCSQNCKVDSNTRNVTAGGKWSMALQMRSSLGSAIGVSLRGPARAIGQYGSLTLKIYPTSADLKLTVRLTNEPHAGTATAYKAWSSAVLVAGRWNTLSIPMSVYGAGTFNALRLIGIGAGSKSMFYVDDVVLQ